MKENLTSISNNNDAISSNNVTIAENEQKVYDAGYDTGVEDGKKSEYDAFWDEYQRGGTVMNGAYLFSGRGWNLNNFKPKYNLVFNNTVKYIFAYAEGLHKLNLPQMLNELGLMFDTSGVVALDGFYHVCEYTGPCYLPTFDTRGSDRLNQMFYYANLIVGVEKIILRDDGTQTVTNTFIGCTALQDLVLEGVIGQNGFDLQWSTKLSKASIQSIINALSDITSGLTVTLSKTAVNNAFETSTGTADGSTAQEWLDLIAAKSNWTISLV